jgi:hypothetical protein
MRRGWLALDSGQTLGWRRVLGEPHSTEPAAMLEIVAQSGVVGGSSNDFCVSWSADSWRVDGQMPCEKGISLLGRGEVGLHDAALDAHPF